MVRLCSSGLETAWDTCFDLSAPQIPPFWQGKVHPAFPQVPPGSGRPSQHADQKVGSSCVDRTIGDPVNQQQSWAAAAYTYHVTEKSSGQAAYSSGNRSEGEQQVERLESIHRHR